MKRVVVSGLGALTPIGNNVNDFWNNLIKGQSGVSNITKFDASQFKTQIAAELKDFDPTRFIKKGEAKKMDAFVQYAIAIMDEWITDSSINLALLNLKRIGLIWSTGISGIQAFEDEVVSFNRNPDIPRFSPFLITKMISNMAAGHISIRYGLKGISYVTTSAF